MLCQSQYRRTGAQMDESDQSIVDDLEENIFNDNQNVQNLNQALSPFIAAIQMEGNLPKNFMLTLVACNSVEGNELRKNVGDLVNALDLLRKFDQACSAPDGNQGLWDRFFEGRVDESVKDELNENIAELQKNELPSEGFLDLDVKSETEAVERAEDNPASTLAVLTLNDSIRGSSRPEYTLRLNGTDVEDFFGSNFVNRWEAVAPPTQFTSLYPYVNVQNGVEQAIVAESTGETSFAADVKFKQSPWVSYELSVGSAIAAQFMGILVALAFQSSSVMVLKSIVQEKELRLREAMRMMGMTEGMFWSSWFVTHFVTLFITSFLMALAGIYPFQFTDWTVNLVFFLLWTMMLISFNYMVSTFFSNARLATIVGAFLYIITIVPGIAVNQVNENGSSGQLWTAIAPASALFQWGAVIAQLEVGRRGMTWGRINVNVFDEGSLSGANLMAIVSVEIVVFALLAWYLDNVIAGKNEQARSPWFVFRKEYWCSDNQANARSWNEKSPPAASQEDQGIVEQLTDEQKKAIAVQAAGLSKHFGRSVRAVENFSVNFVRNEVSALLGHNGAGKTTTFRILTGSLKQSEGEAYINGMPISSAMDTIREDMGVCPQFDVLYPMLTVLEHLRIYAAFAGVPPACIEREALYRVHQVNLWDKRDSQARHLSGGQRRKLSLAIAFIGSPSVVFLDEPTSGMDPSSRRFAWDIIRAQRSETAILLTTHFLDEADTLCDRIAIMTTGRLAACGGSVFLKNRFGIGYHLFADKAGAADGGADGEAVLSRVRRHVPGAQLERETTHEVVISLPRDATPAFADMLETLETERSSLGIDSYGMTGTTLEEVFLSIAEGAAASAPQQQKVTIDSGKANTKKTQTKLAGASFLTGSALWCRQWLSVAMKRLRLIFRDWVTFIFQLLIPALFVVAAVGISELEGPSDARFDKKAVNRDTMLDGIAPVYGANSSTSASIKGDVEAFLPSGSVAEAASPFNAQQFGTCSCFCPTGDQTSSGDFSIRRRCEGEAGKYDCVETPDGTEVREGGDLPSGDSCVEAFDQTFDAFLLGRQTELLPCNQEDNGVCDSFFFWEAPDNCRSGLFEHGVVPNPSAFFATAVGVNELNSFALAKCSNDENARIVANYHPLPAFDTDETESNDGPDLLLLMALLLVLGGAVLSAAYSIHPANERSTNAKHLQMVSGVNKLAYWLANYCVDFGSYLVPFGVFSIIFTAFNADAFSSSDSLSAVAVTWLLFGWAAIPLAYLLHFFFDREMNSFIGQLGIYFFFGFGFIISGVVLETLEDQDAGAEAAWSVLQYVYRLLPQYTMSKAIHDIAQNDLRDQRIIVRAGRPVALGSDDPFSDDVAGKHMAFLGAEGLVFFALTVLYDYFSTLLQGKLCGAFNAPIPNPIGEDDDVQSEKQRIEGGMSDPVNSLPDSLILRNVSKVYGNGTPAVRSISAGIERGRCFGLLGVNGAGKTTTFKILTGEFLATSGDAFIRNRSGSAMLSVSSQLEQARQLMGYCPQYNALSAILTPREHLEYYAKVRGVPLEEVKEVVSSVLSKMQLDAYADRLAVTLSGGNKRKLCVAIALIGNPPLVLLDEPSTVRSHAFSFAFERIVFGVKFARKEKMRRGWIRRRSGFCGV